MDYARSSQSSPGAGRFVPCMRTGSGGSAHGGAGAVKRSKPTNTYRGLRRARTQHRVHGSVLPRGLMDELRHSAEMWFGRPEEGPNGPEPAAGPPGAQRCFASGTRQITGSSRSRSVSAWFARNAWNGLRQGRFSSGRAGLFAWAGDVGEDGDGLATASRKWLGAGAPTKLYGARFTGAR